MVQAGNCGLPAADNGAFTVVLDKRNENLGLSIAGGVESTPYKGKDEVK